MKVAIVQFAVNNEESKEQKIIRMEGILDNLKGTDLIVLPELWNIGFFAYEEYAKQSELLTGPTFSSLARKAKELGSYIFTGSISEQDGDKCYNTAGLIDREGRLLGTYRKMHLFAAERQYMERGDKPVVIDTEFGKIGMSICYDIRFPELFRKEVEMGAEILVNCAGWPYPRVESWNMLHPVRAMENQCYMLSCCCAGASRGNPFIGRSMVIDPWGTVQAAAGNMETVVKREIFPEQLAGILETFTALKDSLLY